ncbi:AraC family transcriptional regulator [Flavobacterium sp. CGRL1]
MLKDLMNTKIKQLSEIGTAVYMVKKDAVKFPLGEFTEMQVTVMLLIKSGTFVIQIEQDIQYLRPFDLMVFPKGSRYREIQAGEKLKFYFISFPNDRIHFIEKQSFEDLWSKKVFKINLDQTDYLVLSLICRLLQAEGNVLISDNFAIELRRISSNLVLFELKLIYAKYLASAVLHISRAEKVAMEFLTVLSIHCRKHHTVKFYAGTLYVTPVYLNRAVKEVTGKTAKRLIAESILAEAVTLLEESPFTIAEIAEELEFSSLSAFDVFFKNLMCCTPSEYRTQAAERFKSR